MGIAANRLWLLAWVVGLAACDRCTPESTSAEPPLPVDNPRVERLDELWRSASATLAPQPGTPPQQPLRYRVHDCELGYQLSSTVLGEITKAKGRTPAGQEVTLELIARRHAPQTLAFSLVGQRTFRLADGRRVALEQPTPTFAEARVVVDGGSLREIEGPTSLWSVFGAFPGLVHFFPALPASSAIASRAPWKLAVHQPRDALPVEAKRGAARLPAGDRVMVMAPRVKAVTVELRSWLAVGKHAAAVLEASWNHRQTLHSTAKELRSERWLARYVVLDDGRLLWASALVTRAQRWTPLVEGADEAPKRAAGEGEQRGESVHELRLVKSCNGPVLPPLIR
jgi:hypothetical protein